MIGPNRINREAKGLLDVFRAKVGGQNPEAFEGKVRMVVDELPFLAGPKIVSGFATTTSGTTTRTATVTVPNDEIWLIQTVSATMPLAEYAADFSQELHAEMVIPNSSFGGTVAVPLGGAQESWTGAAVQQKSKLNVVWVPPGIFLSQPGTAFNVVGKSTTAFTCQIYVVYSAFQV